MTSDYIGWQSKQVELGEFRPLRMIGEVDLRDPTFVDQLCEWQHYL